MPVARGFHQVIQIFNVLLCAHHAFASFFVPCSPQTATLGPFLHWFMRWLGLVVGRQIGSEAGVIEVVIRDPCGAGGGGVWTPVGQPSVDRPPHIRFFDGFVMVWHFPTWVSKSIDPCAVPAHTHAHSTSPMCPA